MPGVTACLNAANRTRCSLQTGCVRPVMRAKLARLISAVIARRCLLASRFTVHMTVHAAIMLCDGIRCQQRRFVNDILGRGFRRLFGLRLLFSAGSKDYAA